jgi:uncharacterized cupredoxin-like copper-binding protein
MRLRAASIALVGVLAFALVGTACGGSSGKSSSYKEPSGPAVDTVKLVAGNFFYTPKNSTTKSGIVAIQLKGEGVHTLVIQGVPGFEMQVSNGQTQTLKVQLKPGKYTIYCTLPGHRQAGMQGTITAT